MLCELAATPTAKSRSLRSFGHLAAQLRTDKCNILRAAKKRTKARNKRWDRLRRQVDKGKITLTHGCVCCLQARVMIGALYCGDPWCAREDFISNELEHRSVVLARESIHQRKMVRGGKLDESPCVERTLFFSRAPLSPLPTFLGEHHCKFRVEYRTQEQNALTRQWRAVSSPAAPGSSV